MLVAKRDPFHGGAQDTYSNDGGAGTPHATPGAAPRLARAMSAIQIVGTLLAIPVGLGSAYSMYRTNFSVETTCQSLRANIVVMLDKRVDAGARHMLVRRDVEAFERSCGTVDPDATAAFKELLAAEQKPVAVVTAPARPVDKPVEAIAPRAGSRPAVAAKQPVQAASAAKTEAERVQREAQSSDAAWLAAVRQALVTHAARPAAPQEVAAAPVAKFIPPVVQGPAREAQSLGELPARAAPLASPTTVAALPAATWTATAAVAPVEAGHPVPPGSIPVVTSVVKEPAARSRLGDLVAQIPLLGPMIEP